MRRRLLLPSLALGALVLGAGQPLAQMHHVDTPEHVTRALGVYEWTGDLKKPTAARFVPVSLFINGHFEDAGEYMARPVPFALESGNLYTVERAGVPEGVLDLETAERVVTGRALADDDPAGSWYGFGKFTAEAPPRPTPALPRSTHLAVIQSSSDPNHPHPSTPEVATADADRPPMARRTDAGSTAQNTSTGGATSASTEPAKPAATDTGSRDDTDRPTLARRNPAQDSVRSSMGRGKKPQASVTAAGPAPGDDPDRPTLTHNTAASELTRPLTGMPADMRQAVAVSDPVIRDPHPFARAWEGASERSSTLTAMAALARPRVAAYMAENRLVPTRGPVALDTLAATSTEGIAANTETGAGAPPKLERGKPTEYGGTARHPRPAAKQPHAARPPAKAAGQPAGPAPLVLQAEQVAGFTLSYGGLPTFVYTAAVAAVPAAGAPPDAQRPATVYVTVVAQRLPSGELQAALVNVTDSLHLDRNPRMHLVDAVDPDASHRASLLFELRGAGSRQFALYRLTSARAQATFTTASVE